MSNPLEHRLGILERRFGAAAARLAALETRQVTAENGVAQAGSTLAADSGPALTDYSGILTGCNSFPISGLTVSLKPYNSTSGRYGTARTATTNSSGRFALSTSATPAVVDGQYADFFQLDSISSSAYVLSGYDQWYPDYAFGTQTLYLYPAAGICWSGVGPAAYSAYKVKIGTTLNATFNSAYDPTTGTKTGNAWSWTGSTWAGTATGTYNLYWSFYSGSSTLTLGVYHISRFGGDAPVTQGNESIFGVSYASISKTPTIATGPFSAAFNFAGTIVGNLTGIGTVYMTEV